MRMSLFQGFVQLGAGLSVGLAGLAAGFAIGIVGDAGVRGTAQQPRLFVGMVRRWSRVTLPEHLHSAFISQILILIFAEVLGLYGTRHGPFLIPSAYSQLRRSHRGAHHELRGCGCFQRCEWLWTPAKLPETDLSLVPIMKICGQRHMRRDCCSRTHRGGLMSLPKRCLLAYHVPSRS